MKTTDVVIIGSGIAGATAALNLARNPQRHIILINRAPDPCESNSRYAQGGIIGRGPGDSPDLLVEDILAAGAGASLPRAASILAEEGPGLLKEVLVETAKVHFDEHGNGEPDWGQEGPIPVDVFCMSAMERGRRSFQPCCRLLVNSPTSN